MGGVERDRRRVRGLDDVVRRIQQRPLVVVQRRHLRLEHVVEQPRRRRRGAHHPVALPREVRQVLAAFRAGDAGDVVGGVVHEERVRREVPAAEVEVIPHEEQVRPARGPGVPQVAVEDQHGELPVARFAERLGRLPQALRDPKRFGRARSVGLGGFGGHPPERESPGERIVGVVHDEPAHGEVPQRVGHLAVLVAGGHLEELAYVHGVDEPVATDEIAPQHPRPDPGVERVPNRRHFVRGRPPRAARRRPEQDEQDEPSQAGAPG